MFFAAVALVAIAMLYYPTPACSDVPQILNYQGKLANTDGTLVANGLYKYGIQSLPEQHGRSGVARDLG